jgi:cytoskeleton protein RodZ
VSEESVAGQTDEGAMGERLRAARVEQGLSSDEVARRLLLSNGQIAGLERGDSHPFYSARFYHQALTKYARLVGIPMSGLPPEPRPIAEAPVTAARPATFSRPAKAAAGPWRSRTTPIAASIVLAASAVGGGYLWAMYRRAPTPATTHIEAPPPAPLAPPGPLPAPETPAPVAENVVAKQPATTRGAIGTLQFNADTWVFVRYADGTVVERKVTAGLSYAIEADPTFLIVGSTDATLSVRGRPVDVARWIRDDQIRIGKSALAASPFTRDAAVR